MLKCNDCGDPITGQQQRSKRITICDGCWDNRGDLVAGKIIPFTDPMFLKIQKCMRVGRGTAKKLIEKCRSQSAVRNGVIPQLLPKV